MTSIEKKTAKKVEFLSTFDTDYLINQEGTEVWISDHRRRGKLQQVGNVAIYSINVSPFLNHYCLFECPLKNACYASYGLETSVKSANQRFIDNFNLLNKWYLTDDQIPILPSHWTRLNSFGEVTPMILRNYIRIVAKNPLSKTSLFSHRIKVIDDYASDKSENLFIVASISEAEYLRGDYDNYETDHPNVNLVYVPVKNTDDYKGVPNSYICKDNAKCAACRVCWGSVSRIRFVFTRIK